MRRGFKTWAEQQAIQQRRNLGLEADAPLSAARLASYLKITLMGPEQIPGMSLEHLECLLQRDRSSWSALTLTMDSCTMIVHNTTHAKARQESNLMHEMAHIICKHAPAELIQFGGLPFLLRNYDADQEEEASWLGACLQLPRSALWVAVKRHMTVSEMAQYFQASEDLIRFRRQTHGMRNEM